METDFLTHHLRTICVMLALVAPDDLEAHVKQSRNSLSMTTSIGVILDPTGYRKAVASGEIDDARVQLEIVEHLLEARQLLQKREERIKKEAER